VECKKELVLEARVQFPSIISPVRIISSSNLVSSHVTTRPRKALVTPKTR
jgi:hypothetical protein